MRSLVRTIALVVVTLGAGSLLASCGKHIYNQDDLTVTLGKHHIDLRWGRLGNAALAVKPELRAAFIQDWTQRGAAYELQNIDVAGVSMAPDGDAADVVVSITYVDKNSMTVRTDAVMERWVRTDSGWLAEKPAALEPAGD